MQGRFLQLFEFLTAALYFVSSELVLNLSLSALEWLKSVLGRFPHPIEILAAALYFASSNQF
jgi:hypothetical protein